MENKDVKMPPKTRGPMRGAWQRHDARRKS